MPEAEAAIAPLAWRVEFADAAQVSPAGIEAIEIAEPRNVTALLNAVAPSEVMAQPGPQADGALVVVWMPPGVNTPATIERDVDEWMRSAGTEKKEASARADVRTVRVLWGGNRAVIYGNQGDIRHALDAVARFAVTQREALALEATMKSTWTSLDADIALTEALRSGDGKRRRHIHEMTEIATRMKIAWLRVGRAIEQLDPSLADPSKRIFAELVAAASLFDQVEMLEDSVQFALEHYEIANTRLIDQKLVRQERIDSIIGYGAIIVLLLIQIWMMTLGL
ncbi:hypothetical protein [Desertibaculum subflavum]|uniref:hypothetical protein n=1 Tax=Desertibaculum subflavum TaxID=2268458 RepID=UPI000E667717